MYTKLVISVDLNKTIKINKEYKYELKSDGPLKMLVIDPNSLSGEQIKALEHATKGYVRGINFWSIEKEAVLVKEERYVPKNEV